MKDHPERSTGRASVERKLTSTLKLLSGVIAAVALCLVLVLLLARGQATAKERVSAELKITQSNLTLDDRSGKLIWTGSVSSVSGEKLTAPWVRVTIYDPEGDSVDSGEATTNEHWIPARGKLNYRLNFDSRGNDMRATTQLEIPNSRSLGM